MALPRLRTTVKLLRLRLLIFSLVQISNYIITESEHARFIPLGILNIRFIDLNEDRLNRVASTDIV